MNCCACVYYDYLCRIEFCSAMPEVIEALIGYYPIVKKDVDHSRHPYCASSEQQYMSWMMPKRRANEVRKLLIISLSS